LFIKELIVMDYIKVVCILYY